MKRVSILALLIALFTATVAFGQITKGSISGTVVDPSGASVSDAQVTAKELHTGTVFTSMSDRSGNYRFNLIPPGSYTVEITKEGFNKVTQQNIGVVSGADSGMGTIALAIGGVSNTVEVTAQTPLVESTQAQVTNTFESTQMQQFPGVTENEGLDNLALYVPGVTASRSDNNFSNTNGTGFAVNGVRQRNNDQQIDGQNNNDNSVTGPALAITDNEFVGEYQIITNNFGAEYGRNAGSVVNVITKTGTNNYHGSIFATENNNAFNSMDNIQKRFDQLTTLPYVNDLYTGATIGGPVLRNKLFFFAGVDGEVIDQSQVYGTGKFSPTQAGLATLANCFPGNTNVALLQKYSAYGNPKGLTTTGTQVVDVGTCLGVEEGLASRAVSSPAHIFDTVGRVDYIGNSNSVYVRYLMNKSTFFGLNDNGAAGYVYNEPSQAQVGRGSWTHNISNQMVNELAVSYGRLNVEFGGGSPFEATASGISSALTNIGFTSGAQTLGFGPLASFPQRRIVNTWQVQDNWRYNRGSHQLKAGVNWTYQRSPNTFLPNYNGSFTYSSLANFLANTPRSFSIVSGSPSLDFREYDTFGYVGDDWKVTKNLTVNLGLTYTYFGQPENLFNQKDTARESGPNPFFDPTLPLSARTAAKIPVFKTAFGPGVGFAWSPGFAPKTVVRGGYRLAYDPPFYNVYLNEATAAPQVLAVTKSFSGPTAGTVIPLPANPIGTNVRATLAPFIPFGTLDPRNITRTDVSPNFKADHYHAMSFGIEQQLSKASAVEVRYAGTIGRDLIQTINANPFIADLAANFPSLVPSGETPCSAANAVVPNAVGRVHCDGGILRRRANTGYSNYNSLQTEFRSNNLFDQLTLRAAYTWSKTHDNASDIFATFGSGTTTAIAQNPVNIGQGEYGVSQYDIPQNLSLNFVEQIPVFKSQRGVLGHLLGGWAVSGAYILGSGVPYTPEQFLIANGGAGTINNGDYVDYGFNAAFNSGAENLRPFMGNPAAPATAVGAYAGDACNYLGVGCALAPNTLLDFNAANTTGAESTIDPKKVRYIVNGATSEAIFGSPFGNVQRNAARDYKTNITNAAVYKNIKFTERLQAQFQMTMLNAFNHRNFGSVDPFIDDAGLQQNATGFGDPTLTSGGSRKILFGMKFRF